MPNEKVGLSNGNFDDKFKQQHSSVREKQMSSSQENINLSVFFSFLQSWIWSKVGALFMMMNEINDEIHDSKMDEYRAMVPVDQPVVHIVYNIILY